MDYLIDINDFHGPLDLLLHLVKKKEKDIYEISTHEIIEDYLNYIKTWQELNIDIASEFLVMAATLIHLKSKMLVGDTSDEDNTSEFDIETEDDLKKKILEYETYKNVTEAFKSLEEKRNEFYTKSPESLKEYSDYHIVNDGSITIDDLIKAFLLYQERINFQKPMVTRITKKEISVEDRIKVIKEKLEVNKKVNFFDLFEEVNKEYVVVTFLAILQMSKNEEITIKQENNFDNIFVEKVKL